MERIIQNQNNSRFIQKKKHAPPPFHHPLKTNTLYHDPRFQKTRPEKAKERKREKKKNKSRNKAKHASITSSRHPLVHTPSPFHHSRNPCQTERVHILPGSIPNRSLIRYATYQAVNKENDDDTHSRFSAS